MVGVEDAEEVSWDHGLAEDLSASCLLGRDQDGSSEEEHAGGYLVGLGELDGSIRTCIHSTFHT